MKLAAEGREQGGQSHGVTAWGACGGWGHPPPALPTPAPCCTGWHPNAVLLPAPRGAPGAGRAWQGPIAPGTAAGTQLCPERSPAAQPGPHPDGGPRGFQSGDQWGHAGASSIPGGCSQGPKAQQHHHEPRQRGPATPARVQAASCNPYPLPQALTPSPSPCSPFPPPWALGMWVTQGWRRPCSPGRWAPRGQGTPARIPPSPHQAESGPAVLAWPRRSPEQAELSPWVPAPGAPAAACPPRHSRGGGASPQPALPQPGHMCFQCGWELQGVGVLGKQHQIPFLSSNGPQQPPRGRAGGGDARTLQARARGGGNPRPNTGIPAGRERGVPRHQPRAGLRRSVLSQAGPPPSDSPRHPCSMQHPPAASPPSPAPRHRALRRGC